MYLGQVNFFMGFIAGLKAFTAAVLGGIGNIGGAVLGAFLLGILETFGAAYLGGEWQDVFAFGVLILVLVFRRPACSASGCRLMAAPTAVASRQRAEARAEARPASWPACACPWSRPRSARLVGLLGSYLYWTPTSVRWRGCR